MVSNNPFHPEYDLPEADEAVKHISSTRPIAKKDYTCSCCKGVIPKGEKHYKNIYKVGNNRKIQWERTHIKCPGW